MRISIEFTCPKKVFMNRKVKRAGAAATMIAALAAVLSVQVSAADKYATFSSLAVYGRSVFAPACLRAGELSTVALTTEARNGFEVSLLSMIDGPNRLTFTFGIINVGNSGVALPLDPVQAWRSYLSITPGIWDSTSLQQLSNGVRLSDAVRFVVPSPRCDNIGLRSVEIVEGDLQVSTVGQGFAVPNTRVRVNMLDARDSAIGTSVALTSELVGVDSLDTGIDGPRTASLIDASETATFTITPGSSPGIKRFVVKARTFRSTGQKLAASTVLTVAHVPEGAPTLASVPVVEYAYAGGTGAKPRYLASTTAATQLLDSSEDPSILRTGQVWRAFTAPDATAQLAPVCQFFGRLGGGVAVTHFFTAEAVECNLLRSLTNASPNNGVGLRYEGVAFYAVTPNAQQQCPPTYPIPIVRYFVASPAPHHLYLVTAIRNGGEFNAAPAEAMREKIAFCTDVATAG